MLIRLKFLAHDNAPILRMCFGNMLFASLLVFLAFPSSPTATPECQTAHFSSYFFLS
eukprot:m.245805 g.245805  ORF g.245805 m.245805 type:complete len:57 (-) comp39062_c0_seq1:1286-1456(-)